MKRKEKLEKAVYIINGLLFLMEGITLIYKHEIAWAIMHLAASMFNILVIFMAWNRRAFKYFNYLILVLNIVFCTYTSINSALSGKQYIQYVWLLASILTLVALIIQVRRHKLIG